jgi:hypothetical protein
MARIPLNRGAVPMDGTGTPLRDIFEAFNAMAAELDTTPPAQLTGAVSPLPTDDAGDGYAALSAWLDTVRGGFWRCASPAPGAAQWTPLGAQDHPGYVPGLWYGPNLYGNMFNTRPSANVLRAIPVQIAKRVKVDQVAVAIATGVANGFCKVGLYTNVNGLPDALIAEAAADMSLATNNSFPASGFLAPITLEPGIVWFAAVMSGTAYTISQAANTGQNANGLTHLVGGGSIASLVYAQGAGAPVNIERTAAVTYQQGVPFFPGTFGAITRSAAHGAPLVAFRAAA